MLLNCSAGEDSWESLGLQEDQTSPTWRKSMLNIHWKDWCWSWISNTLATWCEKPTHWKRSWCWERLKAGGEGDDRGWDGWMASPRQWKWVWANSGRWWRTRKPGVLQFWLLRPPGVHQASQLFTICWSLLKFMSIESMMPSNNLMLCCPLLLLSLVFSSIWIFSSELAFHIRWLNYWSFNFNISPSNEYSGLISFRIDWSPYHPRDSQESSPELWRNFNIKCRIST